MNGKIKIGEPHLYFKISKIAKFIAKRFDAIFILAITLIALGLGLNAFLKMDLTTQLAMSTWFFFCTTVFVSTIKFEKFFNKIKEN